MPQPRQPLTSVKVPNPSGGVIRTVAREEPPQVPYLTDARNVLPYDLLGRHRIGQREGLLPLYNLNTIGVPAGASIIQGMLPVGFIVQPGATIAPAPAVVIADYTPSGIISTNGRFLVVGSTASVPWSVSPAKPITIDFSLVMNAVSTLLFTGGAFNPPNSPISFIQTSVAQEFNVIDIALNTSPIQLTANMEIWAGRNAASIYGISIPAAGAGNGYVVCLAGVEDSQYVVVQSTVYTYGGNAANQTFTGAFTMTVTAGNTGWSAVETANGASYNNTGNGYNVGFGIPISTSNLSTGFGVAQPSPYSSYSTMLNVVLE